MHPVRIHFDIVYRIIFALTFLPSFMHFLKVDLPLFNAPKQNDVFIFLPITIVSQWIFLSSS